MWTRIVLLAVLLFPLVAAAQVNCGSTIGPRQRVTLGGDLGPCDGVDAALVVDSGTLDLAGFTVSCADVNVDGDLPQGIILTGRKARVTGGAVTGCSNGVGLAGSGKHTVEAVTVRDSDDDGFDVLTSATKNTLVGNTSANNGDDGFYLRGDKNRMIDNVATGNAGDGIDLPSTADKNKLVRNRADANQDSGIEVGGSRNAVTAPSTARSAGNGVLLLGNKNRVSGGASTGNGVFDVAGCAGNKVRKLAAGNAAPDCR